MSAPVWRLTFQPLVRKSQFIGRLSNLLKTLEASYQHPVDVEFTLHLNDEGEPTFNLVQCRPLATIGETKAATLPSEIPDQKLLFRTRGHFMGGNINLSIQRVVRVDATVYSQLNLSQRYQVARLVGEQIRQSGDKTMLIGPGRWGTSSPELGVPVRFADIAGASVLVEVAEMEGNMVPDLSYGSHFFQDLVETEIAYVALFPNGKNCIYQPDRLPGTTTHSTHISPEQAIQAFDLRTKPLQLTGMSSTRIWLATSRIDVRQNGTKASFQQAAGSSDPDLAEGLSLMEKQLALCGQYRPLSDSVAGPTLSAGPDGTPSGR